MKTWLIGFTFFIQALVISSIFYNAQYPLWYGKEVRFETEPVDPRDLFLGNYASLRLPIHSFPISNREPLDDFRPGDSAYVVLKQDGAVWKPVDAFKRCPADAQCIRGRVQYRYQQRIELIYGLESFYASPERAMEIESQTRSRNTPSRAQLVVMIASNGQARIKAIDFKK